MRFKIASAGDLSSPLRVLRTSIVGEGSALPFRAVCNYVWRDDVGIVPYGSCDSAYPIPWGIAVGYGQCLLQREKVATEG